MKITIITLFPKMLEGFFQESIVKRAQEKKLVEIEIINLRNFAIDNYGTVDDKPYGGGVGMILRIEPIHKAVQFAITNHQSPIFKQASIPKKQLPNKKIILTSAKGQAFNQQLAIGYSQLDHLVIIAGHYEGIDERIMNFVDEEVSLGDFIMTGGEITAGAIVDSIVRLIPGVLKKTKATQEESFALTSINQIVEAVGENSILLKLKKKGVKEVKLLEYPHYTRPENFQDKKVPPILLSGDHKKIESWQIKKSFEETLKKRPDLLFSH